MSEEESKPVEEKKEEAKPVEEKKCCKGMVIDMKTFWTSFFTSLLVVVIYHFGTSLVQIYTDTPLKPNTRYMFVPVSPNAGGMGGMMEGRGGFGGGRGGFGGGRGGFGGGRGEGGPRQFRGPRTDGEGGQFPGRRFRRNDDEQQAPQAEKPAEEPKKEGSATKEEL
ncbi:MAG: hypothetical protein IJJ26_01285 [Victivallales bacterium]|nr:hypothetical protein [Victivallales bacterium]